MIEVKKLTGEYLNDLKPKEVLDLGCGLGKKSLRFLKGGTNVTGIDKNNFRISQEHFKFIQSDVKEYQFEKQYDLIILHFFRETVAIKIIKQIKDHTLKGGLNFLICMSNEDSCSKEKSENFYPSLKKLKGLYSGWEIIKEDQDFTAEEEHGDLPPHNHNLIFLLVKKVI